jgi:hypothetical protein
MRDWELAAARDAMVAQTLDQSCDVLRPSTTDDDYGGLDNTTTPVFQNVPCRIHTEPIVGRYAVGVEGTIPLMLVSLPYGTDVHPQDVLRIAGNGDLAVSRVLEPETWALVLQVEVSPGVR